MATTTRKVEFAFTQSGGAYVYQDISAYVRSIETTRGRQRELDGYQPGTASIVLDNNTRAFDPQYAGMFSSEVKPAGSVRITVNGVVVFVGRITAWAFDYQPGEDSTAIMTAVERTADLAVAELNGGAYANLTTGQLVSAVLNRPEVAYSQPVMVMQGKINTGSVTLTQGDNASAFIDQVARTEWADVYSDRTGKLVFNDSSMGSTVLDYQSARQNLSVNPSFEASTANWIVSARANPLSPFAGTYAGVTTIDGDATYSETDLNKYYANQVYTVSVYLRANAAGTFSYTLTGWLTNSGTQVTGTYGTYTANVTNAGWTRLNVQLSTDQFADGIAVYVDSPTASNNVYVDGLLIEAGTTLGAWFDGNTSNGGSGSGPFTSHVWNGATNLSSSMEFVSYQRSVTYSNNTLADDGSGIAYKDIQIVYGSELMTNRSTTVRINGGTAVFQDASSISSYGVWGYNSSDNLAATDAETQLVNQVRVATYSQPEYRVQSVTVPLDALGTTDQTTIVGKDIHDLFTVKYTPSGIGTQISNDYWIIGVSHSMTPDQHDVTFNLQLLNTQVLTLDSDVLGYLDKQVLA